MASKKLQKTDGLGPLEIKKIRIALRLVWHRSYARALVVKRCTRADGFQYCEVCGERTPKFKVDHTEKVGDVDSGFIERLFVGSHGLKGMCKTCHDEKTKAERREERARNPKPKREKRVKDFY